MRRPCRFRHECQYGSILFAHQYDGDARMFFFDRWRNRQTMNQRDRSIEQQDIRKQLRHLVYGVLTVIHFPTDCPTARMLLQHVSYALRRMERDTARFLMVTFWESEDAIRAFAGCSSTFLRRIASVEQSIRADRVGGIQSRLGPSVELRIFLPELLSPFLTSHSWASNASFISFSASSCECLLDLN